MREKLRSINWKNLLIRLGAGLVLLAVVITAAILGGVFWFALVAFLSLFAMFEFYRAFGIHRSIEAIFGYLAAAAFWVMVWFGKTSWTVMLVFGFFILQSAVFVLKYTKSDVKRALVSFTGFIYPSLMIAYFYFVRDLSDGAIVVWYIFLGSWGADVFAYLTGILFGKHHMSPVVSPKKTWEGAIGGFVGAVLLGALFAWIFRERFTAFRHPVVISAVITGVSSVISVFGDLVASAFKRSAGIKDYSKLIPGHGGVLDRFDSCIFVAPVIYYLALFLSTR